MPTTKKISKKFSATELDQLAEKISNIVQDITKAANELRSKKKTAKTSIPFPENKYIHTAQDLHNIANEIMDTELQYTDLSYAHVAGDLHQLAESIKPERTKMQIRWDKELDKKS